MIFKVLSFLELTYHAILPGVAIFDDDDVIGVHFSHVVK